MELKNKRFIFEKVEPGSLKSIEDFICSHEYELLRWAVVSSEKNRLIIELTCIKD